MPTMLGIYEDVEVKMEGGGALRPSGRIERYAVQPKPSHISESSVCVYVYTVNDLIV